MFDTNKVASNIKNARTKMNLTQMNLADEMNVSYQAVSNWERGNAMPDISKLPELCKILKISFEELVGERTAETDITEKLMKDENADVTLEEMAQVAQLVKPDKIERKVNEVMGKGEKISLSALISLAPFMDKETLSKMAAEMTDINLKKLCAIAPFIERETMDKIVAQCIQDASLDLNNVVAIAPFLSKATIQKVAEYMIEHNQAKKLVTIAPFMDKEMFPGQINFGSTNEELEDLDEEEVAKIAFEMFKQGNDVSEYLNYMDEEDVEKLAIKALETGRSIECYLDYMDENAIKKLLLKAVNK